MTREEAIHELGEWLEQMIQHGVPSHSAKRKALATAIALLSAEAVPQSEQYKKGFEDAKRAYDIEYARESIGRPYGEWLEVHNSIVKSWFCSKCGNITASHTDYCAVCGADMRGDNNE